MTQTKRKYLQAGVRRNGTHAIAGWCVNQLNLSKGTFLLKKEDDIDWEWYNRTHCNLAPHQILRESNPSKGHVVMLNYPLKDVLTVQKETGRTLILYIRSAMNWIASSLALEYKRGLTVEPDNRRQNDYIEFWKDYKSFAVRVWQGKYNGPPVVIVDYDRWTMDRDYRIALADQLGAEGYDGAPYQTVNGIWGSSFDEYDYNGTASSMRLNQRYESMLDDPVFLNLVERAGCGYEVHLARQGRTKRVSSEE